MSVDDELEAIKEKKMTEMRRDAATKAILSEIREPIPLTDSNFSQELAKYPLTLVDFWAPWCGPCRMVAPVIDQLAHQYAGKVVFGKVNVDENQLVASSFGIRSIPTMIVFREGKAVDVIVGAVPRGGIETKIKEWLARPTGKNE